MNVSTLPDPSASRGAVLGWRRPARLAAAVALVPLVVVLAACGSSGSGGAAAAGGLAPAPSGQGGQGGQGGGQGGAGFPGASGLVAAVSPGSLQVQSADSQTTVTYTSSTRFTQTVAGALAAGQCVMVTGTPVAGSAAALTATSVRIEEKVNGSCPTVLGRGPGGGGFGGSGGGFGGGQGSAAPRPSGAPSGLRDLAFATGTVSTVSGTTMTMKGVLREGRSTAGPSASTSTITVTLGSTATVTQTVAATSAVAVVGVCASAIGKADDRGDLAATSIAISKPGASGCRSGFGGFGGRGGGADGTAGPDDGSGSGTNG